MTGRAFMWQAARGGGLTSIEATDVFRKKFTREPTMGEFTAFAAGSLARRSTAAYARSYYKACIRQLGRCARMTVAERREYRR